MSPKLIKKTLLELHLMDRHIKLREVKELLHGHTSLDFEPQTYDSRVTSLNHLSEGKYAEFILTCVLS